MNEAIKLAIKKGDYKKSDYWFPKVLNWGIYLTGDDGDFEDITNAEIILDPLFWQALGKALGWQQSCNCKKKHLDHLMDYGEWIMYAHQYFDLVLTGGNTDEFWEKLLTSKQ